VSSSTEVERGGRKMFILLRREKERGKGQGPLESGEGLRFLFLILRGKKRRRGGRRAFFSNCPRKRGGGGGEGGRKKGGKGRKIILPSMERGKGKKEEGKGVFRIPGKEGGKGGRTEGKEGRSFYLREKKEGKNNTRFSGWRKKEGGGKLCLGGGEWVRKKLDGRK